MELLDEESIEEITTTGDVAGYSTPFAFSSKEDEKKKKKRLTKSTGYSVVSETLDNKDLKQHSKNLKDKVVKIKMTEALKSINEFCGLNDKSDVVKDEYVIQTMRYLELLKELKKSGNKNKKVV